MSLALQHIPSLFLCPTPDNPRRKIDETAPAFLELVESIKAVGILQPLLARPHPEILGYYDLRAGERRYRAGIAAGLESLPVIVREMDDKTAMEITVLENLQRQDLSPLEEARGIRSLLDTGHPLDVIAAELGKSAAWCHRRAKLLALNPEWIAYGEKMSAPAAHLELIARYPAEVQTRLYKEIVDKWDNGEACFLGPDSLSNLKEELAGIMHELKLAPFPTDDELLLPAAGSCLTCPKRSGCQPDLFSDDTTGDTCLDTECWDAKRKAHLDRTEAKLKQEHPGLIKVKGEQAPWKQGDDKLLSSYEYKVVKKTTPGAVPALITGGKGEGEVKYILPERSRSTASKELTKATTEAAAAGDPKAAAAALKEKRDMLEKRRWAHVADYLKKTLANSSYDGQDLIALAAVFGTAPIYLPALDTADPWKSVKLWNPRQHHAALWQRLIPQLQAQLFIESTGAFGPRHRAAIDGICALLGLDPLMRFSEASHHIPEPKSWAALEKTAATPDKGKAGFTAAAAAKGHLPAKAARTAAPIKSKAKVKGITQDGKIVTAGLMADRGPENITVGQPSAEWMAAFEATAEPAKRKPGRPAKKSA